MPVILYPDRKWLTFVQGRNLDVEPAKPLLRAKTVFLTDARAVSAAETFLGIIQHHKLGTIIGEPTAATNGNVRVLELPGGYEIRFTGIKVVNYDGSQFHGRGIRPDRVARRTRQGVIDGRDEVLEAALRFLEGKKGTRRRSFFIPQRPHHRAESANCKCFNCVPLPSPL